MMSELLGYVNSEEGIIWNKGTVAALNYLGFRDLPQHSYQMTGASYRRV